MFSADKIAVLDSDHIAAKGAALYAQLIEPKPQD
jgi:hypothetical protein